MIRAAAVVVPAHDEGASVAACVAAVRRSLALAPLAPDRCHVVVVADGCHDATASAARLMDAHVLEVPRGGVGAARAEGAQYAIDLLAGVRPGAVWLASTDADTLVPPWWITSQLRYAEEGHDAVAGTVEVGDWSPRPEGLAAHFARRFPVTDGHAHVHGANLGVRASAYIDAGGFPGLATGEDRALVDRLAVRGHAVRRPADLPVLTSARRTFRAPDGFGRLLDDLEQGTV